MSTDLTARLAHLERSVLRLRALLAGVAVTAAAGLCAAWWQGPQAAADVLRAKGVVIVDDEGRERILIGAPLPKSEQRSSPIRDTGIVILDADGKDRLMLGENKALRIGDEVHDRRRAFSLLIYDRTGEERGGFGTFDGGKAVIVLDRMRPDSDGVALLADPQTDFVGIVANHRRREGRYVQGMALGVQRGTVFFNMDDATGRRRMSMKLPGGGDPVCRILDAEGDGARDVFAPR